MSLRNMLHHMFGWTSTVFPVVPKSPDQRGEALATGGPDAVPDSGRSGPEQPSDKTIQWAKAWLAAFEAGQLRPPADVHNAAAWDEYWKNQMKIGALFEQGMADQMASDSTLPGLLAERGARSILCAGNGMSTEATSLALLGFEVTALDISSVPGIAFGRTLRDPEYSFHRIPGYSVRDDGSAVFGTTGPIDPTVGPNMHHSAAFTSRAGGSLSFVTGDLMSAEVCPGPFDVIVERRTLQLFPEAERLLALERVVARLSDRGVLISHEHQGRWKFGDDRTHFAKSWLASHGFVIESKTTSHESRTAARLARLMFSSG